MPNEEPLSEDDYPDVSILATGAFERDGAKKSINYIREEGQDFYRPLNVQIEEKEEAKGE